jgi:hypothetical protein
MKARERFEEMVVLSRKADKTRGSSHVISSTRARIFSGGPYDSKCCVLS